MKGILGRKIGMTEKFTKDGKIIPVTVVSVEPNVITQIKTVETDGYNAIQVGTVDKKEIRTTKAEVGHAKKANVSPKRFLKEIKVSNPENYELGSTIEADIFEQGEKVDVTGVSKGKGTAGVIKRHNYSRGPVTHGSRHHRRPGSLGALGPLRVFKGTKLPGRMGCETTTIQNLTVVEVDTKLNYILISGNIPGPKQSLVVIKEAIKGGKKENFELISFEEEIEENEEETIVEKVEESKDESIEETKEEPEVEAEEKVEEPVEEEKQKESTEESK